MSYYKKLIGERIYLSPRGATQEEVDQFTTWMNEFEVTDYIGRSGLSTSYLSEKDYLEESARDGKNRIFNIVTLDGDKLIGTIELTIRNWIDRGAVLGIFIGDQEYRSGGYGTEAIQMILEYGFRYMNLHSIQLDLLGINERAHKCYLKCGFKDTGRRRENIFLNGKYYDRLQMDILESEFTGIYIKNNRLPEVEK